MKLQARNISLNQWKVNEIIVCMLKQTWTYDEVGNKSHTFFHTIYKKKDLKNCQFGMSGFKLHFSLAFEA